VGEDKLGEIISVLDTAAGMLIVAAKRDETVRKAKELISDSSFKLGNLIDLEGGEAI